MQTLLSHHSTHLRSNKARWNRKGSIDNKSQANWTSRYALGDPSATPGSWGAARGTVDCYAASLLLCWSLLSHLLVIFSAACCLLPAVPMPATSTARPCLLCLLLYLLCAALLCLLCCYAAAFALSVRFTVTACSSRLLCLQSSLFRSICSALSASLYLICSDLFDPLLYCSSALLTLCATDLLVCWSVGLLVCWSVGLLVCSALSAESAATDVETDG
jgi:hypothetical protein